MSANNEKYVFSNRYGIGKIVARETKEDKTIITVQFKEKRVRFDEKVAFKNKALVLK